MKWHNELPRSDREVRATGMRRRFEEEAAELRANPNQWGELEFGSVSRAQNVRTQIVRGEYKAFQPADEFEATCRGASVLVRYVGYHVPQDGDVVVLNGMTPYRRCGDVWLAVGADATLSILDALPEGHVVLVARAGKVVR